MVIREMLSVRIIRPVIRRKGKSTGSTCLYQSSSPFAAPVATVSGEKSIRRKSPIRKNTDSFLFHRVYLPYSFAIVYEKTQTDIPGHMCIEEIQCE